MKNRDISTFLLYALGFLLLWEWLRPIEQLTDTSHIWVFIAFLLLSLAMSFYRIKWVFTFLIKIFYILFFINRLYYQEGLFYFGWIAAFFSNIKNNTLLLLTRNWIDLSNEFRSFLFFIFLWLMVYLLHYWLLRRQRIFLFFFMTLIYITVLDTFTPYSAKEAIVRTVVAGFTVMGMLTFYRMIAKEKVNKQYAAPKKWMIPLAGMVAFSVLVGIAVPKAAPIWPDPVPYLKGDKKYHSVDKSGGIQRIGYGTNDAQLGGPFLGDNKTVFRIEANEKIYWKVETKDTYTGKGWVLSPESKTLQFKEGDLVPVFPFSKTVQTDKEIAKVFPVQDYGYPHVIYPAGIRKIFDFYPNFGGKATFNVDTTMERIVAVTIYDQPIVPNLYTIEFDLPKYQAKELRQTKKYDAKGMNPVLYKKYTQLPEELPQRVAKLAKKITSKETNWFDKAKAVEKYFSRMEYIYEQKDVAFPGMDDDYVDQFLFETKKGYCNNFSTSMAVMLRTIGIPTRWVKGYTGGEFSQYSKQDPSKEIYEITNNNAHSWVEVYFPNQGWVPFEPTKGFSNDVSISYLDSSTTSSSTTTAAPVMKPVKKPVKEEDHVKDSGKSADQKSFLNNIQVFFKNHWKPLVLILLVALGIAGILYRIRGKWYPYLLLIKFRFRKKDENIGYAYLILLKQLERYGITRKEYQTLRNYARYVDSFFSTSEMTRFTSQYEQFLYHNHLQQGSWKEARELWENLIKKTIA
ncbi:transglutaminaseTgpA domain-containing protein [Neobacillus niacini]|uniref:transglutaminase TgpA family protein n=1 Tax=Neobacillus niacini TaxID=86668 RepID=UPI0028648903|nr:transglutaminaseTgpA domain-containing protein [Neobacillus niacini]MDR7002221.1 transglutaminase-like putative cysteine protease [Neobacillus niacini]